MRGLNAVRCMSTHRGLDGAEQPVDVTVSLGEGSAAQPVGITASPPQNTAAEPNQPLDLAWFIDYVPKRALAQGRIATVCRHWREVHQERAWLSMELAAGNDADLDALHARLREDMDLAAAPATVKSFLAAPLGAQQRAASSA